MSKKIGKIIHKRIFFYATPVKLIISVPGKFESLNFQGIISILYLNNI